MKESVKKLVTKMANFVKENDRRRMTIGIAMAISSFIFIFIATETSNSANMGFGSYFFPACEFIIALYLITMDANKVSFILKTAGIELFELLCTMMALLIVWSVIQVKFCNINGWWQLAFGISLFALVAYAIKISLLLFSALKNITTKVVDKMKSDELESTTKKVEAILKNIVSIAGTLAIIYKFFEPLIDKILGL